MSCKLAQVSQGSCREELAGVATEDQLYEVFLFRINIHHKLWPVEGRGGVSERERERDRENKCEDRKLIKVLCY